MNYKILYLISPLFFLFFFKSISLNNKLSDKYKEFRVSYIYLDGSKKSINEINDLRNSIIEEYNTGKPFGELARQYSMDGNAENGGDLGWFKEGDMIPEFENAIKNRKKGDIFTVDIPLKKWYYVILKTFDDKE